MFIVNEYICSVLASHIGVDFCTVTAYKST